MDCSPDGKSVRRLHAIHLLLIGVSFPHVVRNSRRSERTVRLWVERFNSMGIDGLVYRPRSGRPRKLGGEAVASTILPVVGAVNPSSGQLVSLIVPHCDTEVFQVFLDTMATKVPEREGKRVLLVLDNASWHKTKRLTWHHIVPVFLPPYSPDLNPIERLWQHLKSHYMAGYITKRGEELNDKLFESLRALLDRPETIRSVCRTHSQ